MNASDTCDEHNLDKESYYEQAGSIDALRAACKRVERVYGEKLKANSKKDYFRQLKAYFKTLRDS